MKRISGRVSLILLVLLLLFIPRVEAQYEDDLFYLGITYFPQVGLDHPEGSIFPEDLEIGLTTFEINVFLPTLFENTETRQFHKLAYNLRNLSFANWDESSGLYKPADFHGTEYRFGITHKMSDDWEAMMVLSPGIFSDFDGKIGRDDVRLQALFTMNRHIDPDITFGFGLAYTTLFGRELLLPVLGYNSSTESGVNIDVLLPAMAEVTYNISERVEVGAIVSIKGNAYNVEGTSDTPATQVDEIEYSTGTFGPHARIHIGGPLYLELNGGVTFLRQFTLNKEGNKVNEFEMDRSYFFRTTLRIW